MFVIKTLKQKILFFFVNSPLGYRLVKGAFWSLLGSIILRGLQLLSSILVARMLGKVQFGELAIIQNTIGMFGTLAGFGLGLTATKFISEFRKNDPVRAGRIRVLTSMVAWLTSTITAIILVIIAPWIAEQVIAAPNLSVYLQISAVYLLLNAVNGAQTGALAGFEAFKAIAKINVWTGVLNLPLMILGVYFFQLYGAILGLILSSLFNWVLNHIAIKGECVRNNISYDYKDSWKEKSILWKFTFPTLLSSLITGTVTWGTNAILVNQPNGYASLGIYNATLKIKQLPEMFLGMLMAPLLPILSEYYAKKAKDGYIKTLNYAFSISCIIVVPISLIQIAFPYLTLLPFGKEFEGDQLIVQWLMFQAVLVGLFYPFSSIIASMGRMWFGFIFNLLNGFLLLGLSFLLIPKYNAVGLASSIAISYGFTSFITIIYINMRDKTFIEGVKVLHTILLVLITVFSAVLISLKIEPIIMTILLSVLIIYIISNMLLKLRIRNNL